MSAGISAATQSLAQSPEVRTQSSERLFYVVTGVVMLIATAIGFRVFIAHGKGFGGGDITRQIVPLVVVHGLAMFSWIVLFLVQSVFIWNGNLRIHMRVGVAGAVLAGTMVILGSVTAILSTHYNPALYQPLGGARFFLATMLGEMLSFGTLVAIAIVHRRRAEIHRPMMLLASLMIISGSLGRCPYIGNVALMAPLYVLGPALALGALFLVLQWGMTRRLSRWYALGYSALVIASFVFIVVGHSSAWDHLTRTVVR